MKDNLKLLPLFYGLAVGICLLMVTLYEYEICLPGELALDKQLDFFVATLRLFKFSAVRRALERGVKKYVLWAAVRIALIAVPMVVNTWAYYQFMNVAFAYMAIIGMLTLLLVYPTRSRYLHETGQD